MQECPKLKNRAPEQIASFLIKKFNEEKVEDLVDEFKEKGFTSKSLVEDKNNLFQFLVLVAFDRRPFSPYEIVWDQNDPQSVFSVLKKNGLLELTKIQTLAEGRLNEILEKLKVKNLHLNHLDLGRRIKTSKTMKELASNIEKIQLQLINLKSGCDVMKLHRMIDDIHGFGPTIASKFIMYVIRCMGIGNIAPSEFGFAVRSLEGEWRNSKWVKQLKDRGILEEVYEKLKNDPFAFDYFWDLDRYYCSEGKCEECEL